MNPCSPAGCVRAERPASSADGLADRSWPAASKGECHPRSVTINQEMYGRFYLSGSTFVSNIFRDKKRARDKPSCRGGGAGAA